jgi:TfoX/Sxy family transcriptional regulator of competence genes
MAFDVGLGERVRDRMTELPGVTDKRMFGGLSFLTEGNLTVAVSGDDLLVRVGAEGIAEALTRPGARAAVMGSRTMRGWVRVDGAELDDDVLAAWIDRAYAFAATLPPK